MTTALTNLYVRNLPMEWTAADLIALGEKYGPVVSAKVLYNPLTTASRGMGFIRFAEHADATLAIAGMNGHTPDSAVHAKPLNVQFAKDQHARSGESSRYAPYPAAKRAAAAAAPSSSSSESGGGSTGSSGSGAVGFVESLPEAPEGTDPLNVYVVDLPLSFTKEEFQALYEPFGALVTSTVLTDPTSGQSRGIGFARYSNRENAARALKETQGTMLPGATKPLLVRFARDSSRKHEQEVSAAAAAAATTHRSNPYGPHQPHPPPPLPPPGAAYASPYAPNYPYAPPAYAASAPTPYYSHYPPPPLLSSPQHHKAPLTTPPLPQPQPPAAPASSAATQPRTNGAAHPPAAAAADGSSAANAAAYQQAWAAYYAQLGYPGYYSSAYQYPNTPYAAAPYAYPTPPQRPVVAAAAAAAPPASSAASSSASTSSAASSSSPASASAG